MKSIVIASGQGVIPAVCAMILTPYLLSVASLAISIFKRTKARSTPAIALATLGCVSGLLLLILFGLPHPADRMGLALVFVPLPLGVIALLASLRHRKEDT